MNINHFHFLFVFCRSHLSSFFTKYWSYIDFILLFFINICSKYFFKIEQNWWKYCNLSQILGRQNGDFGAFLPSSKKCSSKTFKTNFRPNFTPISQLLIEKWWSRYFVYLTLFFKFFPRFPAVNSSFFAAYSLGVSPPNPHQDFRKILDQNSPKLLLWWGGASPPSTPPSFIFLEKR